MSKVLHLTQGVVQDKQRALDTAKRANAEHRLMDDSAAVTIASWWAQDYPTLARLADHEPVDRQELIGTIEDILNDSQWHRSSADADEYVALEALKHFAGERQTT
ncbi:hypothetical protein [Rhodococcus sp. ACS1]|uniref:hypothetical protein n=1 Tax=Rhodococcus sp. ACS1 TaxID=2028570 RepID=UPI00117B2615|nr:hypothetical protein [Rhodococcus sp. ACS1]